MKNKDVSKEENYKNKKISERDKYMGKVLKYLSFICLFLFLFVLIIFVFVIYQGAISNNYSHLTEAGSATMLGIAITVWIGLNIYNIISKEDLDKFVEEQRNQIEIVNKQSFESINRLDTKTAIHKLLVMLKETMYQYVTSYYFMLKFANEDENITHIDELVEIEYFYAKTTKYYELANYTASLKYNEKCMEVVKKYKESNDVLMNELIQTFFYCREADLIYYNNVCKDKMGESIDEVQLLDSLEMYEKVKNYINKGDSINYIKEDVLAYISNTFGITYQLLLKTCKDKHYLEKAKNAFLVAIEKNENLGRYKRNYGVLIENHGAKDIDNKIEVIKYYKSAMKLDSTDYKAINTYYSYMLKIIEGVIGFDNEILWGNIAVDEARDKIASCDIVEIKDNCIELINKSIYYFDNSITMAPVFCDSYYNKAKAKMLKYYFQDNKDHSLLEDGINYCDMALEINSNCWGALYIKRNIYELDGKLNEAKEINETLETNGKANKNKELYEKKEKV